MTDNCIASYVKYEKRITHISHFISKSVIADWDVSRVTDMARLFSPMSGEVKKDCNPDISKWNVSKVTDFVRNNHSVCALNF